MWGVQYKIVYYCVYIIQMTVIATNTSIDSPMGHWQHNVVSTSITPAIVSSIMCDRNRSHVDTCKFLRRASQHYSPRTEVKTWWWKCVTECGWEWATVGRKDVETYQSKATWHVVRLHRNTIRQRQRWKHGDGNAGQNAGGNEQLCGRKDGETYQSEATWHAVQQLRRVGREHKPVRERWHIPFPLLQVVDHESGWHPKTITERE